MLTRTPVIASVSPTYELIRIWDTDESHRLTLDWNENDTADRTLNFLVAGGNRSLTIEADSVLNQDLSSDASPTFASLVLTGSSANILTAGLNGITNPAFNVDASTASSATGLNIKSAAAAGGLAISVLSSGANEPLTINSKGSGVLTLNGTATGAIILARAVSCSTTLEITSTFSLRASANMLNKATSGWVSLFLRNTTGAETVMDIVNVGNLGLGTETFGTSATRTLALFNGTVPSTGPIDTLQLFSKDISAGNTTLGIYAEGTGIVATGQADSASSVRVILNINGVDRTFLCI